ncbi:MAG TPA: hypothetical protein EYP82_05670 [Hydrogenothermaceae bacterium]|nr:hypothetical protein [Hydrogenothermaceae bacterium]
MPIILAIFLFFISCGYKKVDFNQKNLKICVDDIIINFSQPTFLDTLNRYILDSIIATKNKLDCSYKKNIDMKITVLNFSFYPVGYSRAQRANVYKVKIRLKVEIFNKEGNLIKQEEIIETTQYFGTGLRADIEKRYAVEELAKLLQIRIFDILMRL